MCMICADIRPQEPDCPYENINAVVIETGDAAADTSTSYTISPGDTFVGTISHAGDRDWVRVELTAGEVYAIALSAAGSGVGTLPDPYLRIYDQNGNLITFNDDGGPSYDSLLNFTATYTGTYYIAAGAWNDASTGTYEMSVTSIGGGGGSGDDWDFLSPVDPGLVADMSRYLTHGFWSTFGSGGPARAFDTSNSNVITVNLTGLTAEGRQLALWALEAWEMVANIRFQVVTGSAMITFDDNDDGAYAWSNYSGSGIARISDSSINVSTDWLVNSGTSMDSYSFQTYIHEIGHALGLGHQGNYNNTGNFSSQAIFRQDSWQMSVMSYFSQTQNPYNPGTFAYVMTAMMADIHAIQFLYGAAGAGSATAGNTVWGANTNMNNYLAMLFNAILGNGPSWFYNGNAITFTIYDVGGNDTIDLSVTTVGNRIDLRPGAFSDINGGIGNVGIYIDTIIENVIGGSGNDTIIGNDANNTIRGGGGNDLIYTGGGRNTVYGGDGNDTIHAGSNDTVYGGSGTDRLVIATGGPSAVSMTILSSSGSSRDGYVTFSDGTRLYFFSIEELPNLPIVEDTGGLAITGTMGADTLIGTSGNDTIDALAGNDSIDAVGGNNIIWGGRGNDTIRGGTGNDTIGGGLDHDLMYGTAGNNLIWGGEGNDTAYGGTGNDTIGGGTGNDLIDGTAGGRNELWGGRGNDTVIGGNNGDRLGGGDGNDSIRGGSGNDTIYSGAGDDTVWGGAGADTFVFFRSYDSTRIMDFESIDQLDLASGLWRGQGSLTAQQVVDRYARIEGGSIVLDFGDANTVIVLEGYTDLSGLADQINIL